MSHEYAMSRVRDALEKCGGNPIKAQRLLLQWMEKDQSLLGGLVSPHMQGIIAHAVNHVLNPPKKAAPKKVAAAEATGELGQALLSSMRGGNSETFGFGQGTPRDIGRPGKASKAHIDAITQLAGGRSIDDKKKK